MQINKFNILETKNRIIADNDEVASRVRKDLSDKNIFFLNLMASPGAGKTTTLVRTINAIKDRYYDSSGTRRSWSSGSRCHIP